jgi:hypothetical protein
LKRRLPAVAVAIAVSVFSSGAVLTASANAAAPTATAPVACPGTFQVLNNDRVGPLTLPAGPYVISISGKLTCTQASSLFTTFLEQWTGKLPGGWAVTPNGFRNGATAFIVALTRHKPPSPAPSSRTCSRRATT